MTERARRGGERETRPAGEVASEVLLPKRVGPGKQTRTEDATEPESPWCGKLVLAQRHEQVSPAEALRAAAWILNADRGWAAAHRRTSERGAEPDQGALATAFSYLSEARATVRLPAELARQLEERFGVQADRLRLHVDDAVAAAAALLRARAFTLGADIYFAEGAYAPESEAGIALIAHEVAHVAQYQRGQLRGAVGELSQPSDGNEVEAEELAQRFVRERSRRRYPSVAPTNAEREELWGGQASRHIAAVSRSKSSADGAASAAVGAEGAPAPGAPPSPSLDAGPLTAVPLLRKEGASPRAERGRRAAALGEVVDLLGKADFEPTPKVTAHIEQAGAGGADVRVRFGAASPVGIVRVRKVGPRYLTDEETPQVVPLSHSLFVPASGLSAVVRVQIGAASGSQITGYLATSANPGSRRALARSIAAEPAVLGLRGFEMPRLDVENELRDGTLIFGTKRPTRFELGGWVAGDLTVGLVNGAVTFEATADVHARGLRDAELRLARDDKGQLHGSAQLAVDLGDKFGGSATAAYRDGDVAITGELSYASEKFRGKLGLMVADVATAEQMVRAQLDPLGVQPIAGVGGAGGAKPTAPKGKKGERGIAGWGSLDFAFTDWLVGKAQVVYGPTGHLTVIGKIAPPQRLDLMRTPKAVHKPIVPETCIEASYGLPYIADVHVGIGVSLSANAELGPIYMTDLGIEGVYSTDPTVMNAFSITGALHAQAKAGLSLDVKGYAGLRVLKHSVNFGAAIKGDASLNAYAEARPTLGYREVASPTAGKQGEYYLKGHLEMAAQPVLALGGRLFIELDSPWWSPAPDKIWDWPLAKLEYPMPTQLGVGAEVDYVVGSGQWPEFKLAPPSFDPSKFVDTMMADRLPAKSGQAGESRASGQWHGVAPTKPTATPPSISARPVASSQTTGGAGTSKPRTGQQSPEEKKNVPKTQDVAARWNAGLEALGELRQRAEQDPETHAELQQHLAELKSRHGFTKLSADRSGDVWLVDAAMNPEKKDIPIKADPRDRGVSPASELGAELQLKSLVEPRPATIDAEGPLVADLAEAASGQVLLQRAVDPKTAVHQILRDHKEARFDEASGALILPPVTPPRPDLPLRALAAELASQTGVSRITVAKDEDSIILRGEVNPWTPLAKVQRGGGVAERVQLAEAVQEFHEEFTVDQWCKHFGVGPRQGQSDLKMAQEMEPPRVVKTGRGLYQLKESGWRTLKADIVTRFKLSARQRITSPTFAVEELAQFCENDEKLPKERAEYADKDKMTKVFDVLVREQVVRQTSKQRWEFVPVPAQRFLPVGWTGADVRARYFENGSGFSSERDRICRAVCEEVVAVIFLYERAEDALMRSNRGEHENLRRKADLKWSVLYQKERVSKDHPSYPGAEWKVRYASISNYHADHVEPLAWLWEHQRYNNVAHASRLKKCGDPINLRGMWGPDNSGKGARGPDGKIGEYMRVPWVGPSFTGPCETGDIMDAGYGAQFRLNQ